MKVTENFAIRNTDYDPTYRQNQAPQRALKPFVSLGVTFCHNFYRDFTTSSIKLNLTYDETYEISDIRAFLSALKNKNALLLNNTFTFSQEKYSFKKEDIALINLIAASNKFGSNKYEGEKVYLEASELTRLFEIIGKRNFDAVIQDKMYRNRKIIYSDIPLEFEIRQNKNTVTLKQLNELPLSLTEGNEYFFFKGNLYKPSFTQVYKYSPFYKELVSMDKALKVYEEDDTERVCALLEFKLKDISKKLTVIRPPKEKIQSFPLTLRIDVDASDKGILIRPKFYYGEIFIDPFSDSKYANSGKVENRDVISERRIIDLIKKLQFVPSKEGFLLSYENAEQIVYFIKNGIQKLQQVAEVSCSEAVNSIKIYESDEYSPDVHFYNNYLEFSFNLGDDVGYGDTRNIFDALRDYEDYYRLNNGNYISLKNKELNKIAGIIGDRQIETNSSYEGRFTVSRSISLLTGRIYKRKNTSEEEVLREQLENEKLYEEKNNKLKEILLNMEKIDEKAFIVPKELGTIMREYQKTGYRWFKILSTQKLGGILADEMGLGKTLQAIAIILNSIQENKEAKKPSMVVAPTSLIFNWENEIRKFAPELKSMVVYGTQLERRSLRDDLTDVDVIITSYTLIGKDIDEYENIDFSYCFIDEAQQIKNPKTMAAKAVKLIKADAKFALTGTPIENSLSELWSIFDYVMPGYLLSHGSFKEHYEQPIMNYKDAKALESLNSLVKPFILRRLKREVLYELPEKIEHKLTIEMTEEQKEAYISSLSYSKQRVEEEISSKGFGRSHIHIFSALTKLRQVCCHPAIIMPDYPGESGKMLALDSIVEESISNNHRILIFSQFVSVLKLIKTRMENKDVKCLYLDGSIKGQNRIQLVEEFNSGAGNVFLISLKAGGFGLNLTGADVVIHFDPWWNPAVEEQATDRAHRIGQTKTVEVIKLITKGTIEEKILKLHDRKRNIANSVISGKDSEDNFITSLSYQDIEDLFRG